MPPGLPIGRPEQDAPRRPLQGPDRALPPPPPSAGAIARRYTVPPNGAAPFPPPNPAAVHRAARNRAAQRGGSQRTPIGVPKNRPPVEAAPVGGAGMPPDPAALKCRRPIGRRSLQGRPLASPAASRRGCRYASPDAVPGDCPALYTVPPIGGTHDVRPACR